jgi:transposase
MGHVQYHFFPLVCRRGCRQGFPIRLPESRFVECVFANTPQGRGELAALCRRHQVGQAVLEASGSLELEVALELDQAQIQVSIITPAQSQAFRKDLNQQAKTDAMDARMLAEFAYRIQPEPSRIAPESQRNLRELAARRRQLMEQLIQEKNRSQQARDRRVKASLAAGIAFLEKQLADVDQHIGGLMAADKEMQATLARLDSVPAIGPHTAAQLMIACPELGALNRQQAASLAGLAPFNRDSGATHGPRITRGGRQSIRNALYMAAVAAIRFNPVIKRFYLAMVQRGKNKMVALIAAMGKLLIILNSMIRQKKNWDEFIPQTA